MKIILTQDQPGLGSIGDIVSVKDGYARNFLIPRSSAVMADESNARSLNHHKRVLAKKRDKLITGYEHIAAQLAKLEIKIVKKTGEQGRIFGTVTNSEIAAAATSLGVPTAKHSVKINDEVKKIGKYKAMVKLHSDVIGIINFEVLADAESAAASSAAANSSTATINSVDEGEKT